MFHKFKCLHKTNPHSFNITLYLPVCLAKLLDKSRMNKPTNKIMQTSPRIDVLRFISEKNVESKAHIANIGGRSGSGTYLKLFQIIPKVQ